MSWTVSETADNLQEKCFGQRIDCTPTSASIGNGTAQAVQDYVDEMKKVVDYYADPAGTLSVTFFGRPVECRPMFARLGCGPRERTPSVWVASLNKMLAFFATHGVNPS